MEWQKAGRWFKERGRSVWQTQLEWGNMHRVVQSHKRLVSNMSWQLDAWPWLDLRTTTTPSVHLHPFHAKSFRYNPYSSENEVEEEGTSRDAFSKDLHHLAKFRGVAFEWGGLGITDNLHSPQSPFGQIDTFSFRVILLSVNDEMLRGVREENPYQLFFLPCDLGRCPSF